jgi:hypothetical protein
MTQLTADIFRAAKALISTEDKWLHPSVAPGTDLFHEWYKPRSAPDRRLDMAMAIFQAITDRVQEHSDACDQLTIASMELMYRLAPPKGSDNGWWDEAWEDQPERTLVEIHEMLDRAAAVCEAGE